MREVPLYQRRTRSTSALEPRDACKVTLVCEVTLVCKVTRVCKVTLVRKVTLVCKVTLKLPRLFDCVPVHSGFGAT